MADSRAQVAIPLTCDHTEWRPPTPLFLCSFLVTYFFAQMQEEMSQIGLTLGFYGGIAVVGWFYQILFMPETKNKTLEEIDVIFSQPTSQLVKENLRSAMVTANEFVCFRWGKVFSPVSESDIFRKENGHKTEGGPLANHEEFLKPELE
jgi:hypothetical protein